MTGKAMNSIRTAAAAAPSISEGLYRSISSKTAAQSNGSTNERKQTFDAPTSNTSPRDPIPDPPPKNTFPYERRPSINTDVASKPQSAPRRKNSDDDYISSHNRFFNESRNIDPILEDEDPYLPSQPTFSRSTTTDKYDEYSSRRPSNATRSKKPFFLGNLSQENIHAPRKNSYSSPSRRSEDEEYFPYEEGRRSPYMRQENSPSRSSSSDEVNSPKTPGPNSYKEGFSNSRFNLYGGKCFQI
ncbi:hypothetical protein BC943DRAFT_94724 [Umbelopsis sp. AD052]|nr:hypothetical protein BC943DRAFT_94724 [Umbelopsis sp. AD052]